MSLDCNFQCSYCFQTHRRGIIDLPVVEAILAKTAAYHRKYNPRISDAPVLVIWHGGEPLLAGIDFFKVVIELEARFEGIRFQNRIQTNGSLINEDFARFFSNHDFHVGFSLDGPEEIHNRHRRFKKTNRGTFHAVMEGIGRYRLAADPDCIPVIAVVTKQSIGREGDLFAFFKKLRSQVQLDIVDLQCRDFKNDHGNRLHSEGRLQPTDFTPSPNEVGEFLIRLFDRWFHDKSGQVDFNELRNDVRMILQPELDRGAPIHKMRCDPGRIIFDPSGRAFGCDQYVNDEATCLGHILTHSIEEILQRKMNLWEEMQSRLRSPGEDMACNRCEWGRIHMGGCVTCMKYNALLLNARARGLPDKQWHNADLPESLKYISGETYYCQGLRAFRKHAGDVIEKELGGE